MKKAGKMLKPMPVVKIAVGVAKPKTAKMSRGMEKRMISELDSGKKMMRKKDTSKIGSLAKAGAKFGAKVNSDSKLLRKAF